MRFDDKNDVTIMLKIRANLYSLASYYIEQDYNKEIARPRYNNPVSVKKPKVLRMSKTSVEAAHFWKMSEENVWSKEVETQIKRFYNVKRKSGDLEKAIMWERPRFVDRPTCNWWRAKLHGLA